MNSFSDSILKTIAYFDLFDYPLKLGEIKFFLDQPIKEEQFFNSLQQLINQQIVFQIKEFYSLQNNSSLIERRIKGNNYAVRRLKLASKIASVLAKFPYVKGVAISGSLSKDFADENSDLDFFVILAENRLWIGRTVLFMFYKIAKILRIKNWFCLNYFIDEAALEIEEKNIFTAIEIATLFPKNGQQIFYNFFAANNWVYDFLPNHVTKKISSKEISKNFLKRLVEWIFNNKFGNKIDDRLLQFHKNRWKKMVSKKIFTKEGFQLGTVIANKHFCKPCPHNFQKKILLRLHEKINHVQSLCNELINEE